MSPIWPEGQTLTAKGDRRILITEFADADAYHPQLTRRILELEQDERFSHALMRAGGGRKIYHLGEWNCPEAELLNARAIEVFKRTSKTDAAVIDLSWASVYRRGDYLMPHSHVRAKASLVYFLDAGDEDPDDPLAGRFCFVDPRLQACCPHVPHCLTSPMIPAGTPGTMMIFPSQVVHAVNPYSGARPRITLSWNIDERAIPGSPLTEGS